MFFSVDLMDFVAKDSIYFR